MMNVKDIGSLLHLIRAWLCASINIHVQAILLASKFVCHVD